MHTLFHLLPFLLFLLHLFPQGEANCAFPAIFNFGDSNSDTGGLVGAFGPQSPPYGITFFHKPAGRYSDGRLAIDFIAQQLHLPYLGAYLQSVGSNFRTGANFATAGSTIHPPTTTISQSLLSPFSLDVQVNQFIEFKQRTLQYHSLDLFHPLLPEPGYFEKALYVLDIGQNDLITASFFQGLTAKQVRDYVIPEILVEFSNHVKTLYEQGAKNFLIIQTGPLGCLPVVLTGLPYELSQLDSHGCAVPYNNVAKFYNKKLRATVSMLKKELTNATLVLADGYNLKHNLFTNAHKDGFRFTLRACCGFGGGPYNYNQTVFCGTTTTVEGKQLSYNLCEDPSVYVSWDGVHYTEAANHLIADGFFSGNFSIPSFPAGHFCDLYS